MNSAILSMVPVDPCLRNNIFKLLFHCCNLREPSGSLASHGDAAEPTAGVGRRCGIAREGGVGWGGGR